MASSVSTVVVDGKSLAQDIRSEIAAEVASLSPQEREGSDDFLIAGMYMYPTVACFENGSFFDQTIDSCFQLQPDDACSGKAFVLMCDCGVDGCWPFLARIETEDDVVRWSDFEQFHRDWTYDLGPFRFSREAYEAEIRRFAS